MQPTSLTPQQIKLAELKKILPEAFSEGKVDWEKLKITLIQMRDADITFVTI